MISNNDFWLLWIGAGAICAPITVFLLSNSIDRRRPSGMTILIIGGFVAFVGGIGFALLLITSIVFMLACGAFDKPDDDGPEKNIEYQWKK